MPLIGKKIRGPIFSQIFDRCSDFLRGPAKASWTGSGLTLKLKTLTYSYIGHDRSYRWPIQIFPTTSKKVECVAHPKKDWLTSSFILSLTDKAYVARKMQPLHCRRQVWQLLQIFAGALKQPESEAELRTRRCLYWLQGLHLSPQWTSFRQVLSTASNQWSGMFGWMHLWTPPQVQSRAMRFRWSLAVKGFLIIKALLVEVLKSPARATVLTALPTTEKVLVFPPTRAWCTV